MLVGKLFTTKRGNTIYMVKNHFHAFCLLYSFWFLNKLVFQLWNIVEYFVTFGVFWRRITKQALIPIVSILNQINYNDDISKRTGK